MRKQLTFIAACLSASAAQAAERSDPGLIAATAEGAMLCVLAAGKQGVDTTLFSQQPTDWVTVQDSTGFRHRTLPVVISLPKDADGVARVCEVRATLVSQYDQKQLITAFGALLRQKPLQQSNSVVWMLNTKTGPRGLQIFTDKTSEQPNVRLVGAAF